MIRSAPRESPRVSWLYFILCALAIFLTVPFARAVRLFVTEQWGRITFAYLVVACVLAGAAWLIGSLRRRGEFTVAGGAWIAGVAVVYLAWTAFLAQRLSPEEAFHFLEYGALSLLAFRALSHQVRDPSIYPAAVLLCAIVGTLDEFIQWLTPGRVWALEDVGLNAGSAVLMQIVLWKGIRPAWISQPVAAGSWRRLARLGSLSALLLALSLFNTPPRIAWYAKRIPFLGYLLRHEGVMAEYGYRYSDPETGVFFSRFSLEALHRRDAEEGAVAGRILEEYREEKRYAEFLERYSPAVDPFVHEARVHLFRRDRYRARIADFPDELSEQRFHATVALKENRILEKYFPATLAASGQAWPPSERARLEALLDPSMEYVSHVSDQLIVSLTDWQLCGGILLLAGLLLIVDSRLKSRIRSGAADLADQSETGR